MHEYVYLDRKSYAAARRDCATAAVVARSPDGRGFLGFSSRRAYKAWRSGEEFPQDEYPDRVSAETVADDADAN